MIIHSRILKRGLLSIWVSFIVSYTILFFLFQYNYIAIPEMIDTILNWIDLNLDLRLFRVVSSIIILINIVVGLAFLTSRWNYTFKIGRVIFELNTYSKISKWVFAILVTPLIFFSGGAFVIIFFQSPSYYIVLYLLSMIVTIYIFTEIIFSKNYIAESGIKYDNQYYLWEEISSYNLYEGNDLVLELIIESKLLFWKYNYPIEINVPENSLKGIERLLEEKIHSIE